MQANRLVRFDWAIKHLLRNKTNFDILEGFLSELLNFQVSIEQILESESNKNHATDKYNRVDVLVITEQKERILIEVQCSNQWDYMSRILYGTSKLVCEQLKEGDGYKKICKVISVSIVFFNLGEGKDYLYKGTTQFTGLHYHDILGLNANEQSAYGQPNGLLIETPSKIFPEYYLIKVTKFQEKVKNKLDEWIYFLKNGIIEENFSAQGLKRASKELAVLALSEKKRREYEAYQDSLHDDGSFNDMLEITEEKGRKEGREEVKYEVARELLAEGFSIEKVAAITKLSLAEISALINQ